MPEYLHQTLASGRWFELSLCEQLGNIGSEVGRAVRWTKKGNTAQRDHAMERAFDLLDLTLSDRRWQGRRGELCRAREVLVDTFYGGRSYGDTPEKLEKYFYWYALAAQNKKALSSL